MTPSEPSDSVRTTFWEAAGTQTPLLPFIALIRGRLEDFTSLEIVEATSDSFDGLTLSTPLLYRIALKVRTPNSQMGLALILIHPSSGAFIRHQVTWTYQSPRSPAHQGVLSEQLPHMRMHDSIEGRLNFVRALRLVQHIERHPSTVAQAAAGALHRATLLHCKRTPPPIRH